MMDDDISVIIVATHDFSEPWNYMDYNHSEIIATV